MPLSRWPWWRKWFGSRSERVAEKYLRRQGHRVLQRNYRCPLGELDLVTLDGDCLVFVEVRSTATEDPLRAALSVDHAKQRQLTRLATHFLHHHRLLDRPARFDVVTVHWPDSAREPAVTHYPSAFDAVD